MRVLVLGGDGYIGWPLALHLSVAEHNVAIVDNQARRDIDVELGTNSLVPISLLGIRVRRWRELSGAEMEHHFIDLAHNYFGLVDRLRQFRPEAVVHLAEQRSAPYSMMGRHQATYTQRNNVIGTLNLIHAVAEVDPSIHIVKLGTMGEYGTPNIDIEEGWLDVEHNGQRDRVLYPKRPGSWYHLSKVHDSHNLEFACRAWDLRVTDLNQGVVYGHETDQTDMHSGLATRLDYDAVFGTVLNRFAVQAALGMPLTVYGTGNQTRGFINLRDTVRCIELACLNPADPGEFRVFNQITETFSVRELAERVAIVSQTLGVTDGEIDHLDNPRVESESHYYKVAHTKLTELGLMPHLLDDGMIIDLIAVAVKNRDRIDPSKILPTVQWRP